MFQNIRWKVSKKDTQYQDLATTCILALKYKCVQYPHEHIHTTLMFTSILQKHKKSCCYKYIIVQHDLDVKERI